MDARFLLLLLGLCTLFSPSPGLLLEREVNGITVHRPRTRRLLSHGNRQVLAQDEMEQHVSKSHNHDTTSPNFEKRLLANTKPIHDTSMANATDTRTKTQNNETEPTSVPSPLTKSADMQPTFNEEPEAKNASSNVEESDGQKKDNGVPPDKKPSTPPIECGESHCEDPKKVISACLRIPGDGAHKLSMFITSEAESEVVVKVVSPDYLTASPAEVSVSKGKVESIQFLMNSKLLDLESVNNKTITVISSYGECEIVVPLDYLRSSVSEQTFPLSSYIPSVSPRVLAYLVVLILVVAVMGTWLCYKCCKKKRSGDVKYQQLEMIVPGQSTSKERDGQDTAAWDEDWDDDWEDAEAAKSSSRLSQNLSSRGLGARKHNKDGWENSWED